ncbi:MAG: hypothetical protein ABJF10_20615 [Chthoniobacter sp.]|uniref:hypothetical protein n=1 Tax=Chthoniobacter sp. TaxID=2510640 RepID=UPI0032A39265
MIFHRVLTLFFGCVIAALVPVAQKQDAGDDVLKVIHKIVTSTSKSERAEKADDLYDICHDHIQSGRKGRVTAHVEQLIALLDDKNEWVIYMDALILGELGNDARQALPKLEKLKLILSRRTGPRIGPDVLDGVGYAIEQIKDYPKPRK